MLHAPVLQLDAERMQDIDPRNVESLFGMWTVFSRCASTIPDGKRLENLSWRIWARETLCCPPQPDKTIVPAIDIPLPPPAQDVPSLSNSLDSSDSDEACLSSSSSQTSQQDYAEASALSKSRGKEPHLTPDALRKMVVTIQEGRDPAEPLSPTIEAVVEARLSPTLGPKQRQSPVSDRSEQPSHMYSTESSCISTANTVETNGTERASEHRNSDTSMSSDGLIRSGSVVHGFVSPLSSVRSKTSMLKSSPVATKKTTPSTLAPSKSAKFMLGGSSEDEGSSFGSRIGSLSSYKKMALEPRKSSLSHTLSKGSSSQQKKTTSFRDIVEQRRVQEGSENDEGAIASSDEEDDDDADDSVIDDDDEGEWEDSITDDEKPLTSKDFKRIDSSANLASRRSILTAGLTEADRAQGMLSAASKSTSALHRSAHVSKDPVPMGSPEKDDDDGGMMMQPPPGSKPMPILASAPSNYAMAHSPRTTRRHMLSSELTESLRKNLLWERQQKNTTVNAFLKREARSMANLQKAGTASNLQVQPQPQPQPLSQPLLQLQQPPPPPPQQQLLPGRDLQGGDPRQNHSWNNEFFNVANEYHTKGW